MDEMKPELDTAHNRVRVMITTAMPPSLSDSESTRATLCQWRCYVPWERAAGHLGQSGD